MGVEKFKHQFSGMMAALGRRTVERSLLHLFLARQKP
jgi:hypothetical protein